jgi:ABC-type uncharacterized transport system involved in gliding motility auxiliary subunit
VSIPIKYPFFTQVMSLDQESSVTRGISGVILPFASPLTLSKDVKAKVLAQSSKMSWLESEPFDTNPRRQWHEDDVKAGGPYALIADVEGQLKSHFSGTTSTKQTRLLVAGTSAFAWDQYWNEPNQALALASVDYLVADDVMLSLRSRSFVELPIDPELSDEMRNAVKVANIMGVPALFAFYGLFRWRRRERRRKMTSMESIK